jgi:alkanesulfonate monooxygenase
MQLGLHILDFTWEGGDAQLSPNLVRLAKAAEEAKLSRLAVMDHFWQLPHIGPPEHSVLEAYTMLAFVAAHTTHLQLHTLVTSVMYRHPALLAKMVSTLDVLSGGRAALGIGVGSTADEAAGLGLPFPSISERYLRLEEAIQVCRHMWAPDVEPFAGTYYCAEHPLNSPQPLGRPKLMIGGGGEQHTLRLVARYADACNIRAHADPARKLAVLQEHCEREDRDYDQIEKTAGMIVPRGVEPAALLEQLRTLHELGFTVAYLMIPGLPLPEIDMLGSDVIPKISGW